MIHAGIAQNISVYSAGHQLVSAYSMMYSNSRKFYKGDFFSVENDKYWSIIRQLSTKMYNPTMTSLINEADIVTDSLQYIYTYITIKISVEIFIFFAICNFFADLVCVMLLLHWSIKRQVKEIASLLLKIEKRKVIDSVRQLSSVALGRDGFGKQSSTDFTQAIKSYLVRYNISPIKGSLAESINTDQKGPIGKYHIKKITDLQNPTRSSFFSNPPSTKIKKSMLKVGLVLVVPFIPRLIAYLNFRSSYMTVNEGFETISTLATSSAAIQVLLAYSWKMYSDKFNTGVVKLTSNEREVLLSNREVFMKIFTVDNDYIRDKLHNLRVCSFMIQRFSENALREEHKKICLFSLGNQEDVSFIQAYNNVLNYITLMDKNMNEGKFPVSPQELLESSITARQDAISFYITTGIRLIYQDFRSLLEQNKTETARIANVVITFSSLTVVICLIIYYRYWIDSRLKHLKKLNNSFLCLNQDLLDNEYIKSYFGYISGRKSVNYIGRDYLVDDKF